MDLEQLRTHIINFSVMRKNVCEMIPEGASKILEVGCGQGGILLRLQRDRQCTELYGVDMDASSINNLNNFIKLAVSRDIEREEIFPEKYKGYFKYIILHDVVEHLFDPWLTMTRIREFLADDGIAIVATPNIHNWVLQHEILSGRFPYGPGLWHSGHLRWYTPSSLLTVLSIGGFAVKNYCLEIAGGVTNALLSNAKRALKTVQFPPIELQESFPDMPVFTTQYPEDIRAYYPAFFAPKIIAICTKGDLFWQPQAVTYNCGLLKGLTEAVDNPFDVFNPPSFILLPQGSYPEEEV